ncbi:nitroreductase family protein [Desulfovibrio piger]|uniref:nitroreductase family protein n=1 Tax=Desulfovibrio piger TaxID=901 RepID=UPI003A8DD760
MSFAVDISLCRHCGCCASGCVCGLIRLPESGVPYIEPSRQDSCVHCGHCIAVCPEGAIRLDGMSTGQLEETGAPLSAAAAGRWLKARRAIRNFRPEAPDKALLRSALDVAAYAPTAHNAREVGYTILHGRPQVEALLRDTVELMEAHGLYAGHTRNVRNGNDTLFRSAPCLILIHAPERILSETDCATAAAYLELILPSLGLGSCWAGMLLEACAHGSPAGLDLPEGHKLYAALMVGTPAVSYRRIPFRSAPVCFWK